MSTTLNHEEVAAHAVTTLESSRQVTPNVEKQAKRRMPRLGTAIGIAAAFVIGYGINGLLHRAHDNAALVSVNGTAINHQNLDRRLEASAGGQMLTQMIKEEMQIQFARKMGVLPADAEVEAKYLEASKQPNFALALATSHQTPEDVKRGILANLAQAAVINKGVSVTDADIQNFYKANTDPKNPQARYYQPDTVTIAAVITDDQNAAKEALHDLARGVAFAQVATKYSKDKSAANGGLLPPIRRGQLDTHKLPGMEDSLFKMEIGQQLDMLNVAGAWWIVRCVSKTKEMSVPFDKVKEECRQGAMLSKGLAANGKDMQEQAAAFEKSADIKILDTSYKSPDSH